MKILYKKNMKKIVNKENTIKHKELLDLFNNFLIDIFLTLNLKSYVFLNRKTPSLAGQ